MYSFLNFLNFAVLNFLAVKVADIIVMIFHNIFLKLQQHFIFLAIVFWLESAFPL